MDDEDAIVDPVFGVLRIEEQFGDRTYYRGEVELTPKHRVVIDFESDDFGEDTLLLADGLAVARAAYDVVRRHERRYRVAAAEAFLANVADVDYFFGEPGWTAERVAELLTLARIDLNSRDKGVRLIYDCKEGLGEEDLAVTFDEDGAAEEVEDPYR